MLPLTCERFFPEATPTDFSYSTAELDFREEVRDWIGKKIPGNFATDAWLRNTAQHHATRSTARRAG